jgi:alpha-tubulin suppressor-like RCC1 family protein
MTRRSSLTLLIVLAGYGPPVGPAAGAAFSSLSAGGYFTCGLTTDGRAFCWGRNSSGELGINAAPEECLSTSRLAHSPLPPPVPCSSRPIPVAGDLRFRSLTAGESHACALVESGAAYCWGANQSGQLGIGAAGKQRHPVPAPVEGGLRFRTIDAGAFHTCGIASDERTYCWGPNADGRSGTPLDWACSSFGEKYPCGNLVPKPVATELRFAAVSAGFFNACGTAEAVGYCWGDAVVLGTDSTVDDGCRQYYPCSTRPVRVAGKLRFRSITVGDFTSCGITTDGRAYCWGHNQSSTLGIGVRNTTTYHVPQPVVGGFTFDTVAIGVGYACAIAPDGSTYCWGSSSSGALGDVTPSVQSHTPRLAFRRLRFSSITTGWWHACGITTGGETYCWGQNTYGQLGMGHVGPDVVSTPVRVVPP